MYRKEWVSLSLALKVWALRPNFVKLEGDAVGVEELLDGGVLALELRVAALELAQLLLQLRVLGLALLQALLRVLQRRVLLLPRALRAPPVLQQALAKPLVALLEIVRNALARLRLDHHRVELRRRRHRHLERRHVDRRSSELRPGNRLLLPCLCCTPLLCLLHHRLPLRPNLRRCENLRSLTVGGIFLRGRRGARDDRLADRVRRRHHRVCLHVAQIHLIQKVP
mmetsp:Transcript_47295/g.111551  ORF Transcript_47295/g.111551 Transcript_47295/m.111551 type:complete len:225 (-) Transcript_47295:428-1102(-)